MSERLSFGLPGAKPGVVCCGNPEPCTNLSPTCAFRNNPRKTAKFTWERCATCQLSERVLEHVVQSREDYHEFVPSGQFAGPPASI